VHALSPDPPKHVANMVFGARRAGGSVQVQAIKEGSLTVESNGGDVHVGSMAGATAELLTAGEPPLLLFLLSCMVAGKPTCMPEPRLPPASCLCKLGMWCDFLTTSLLVVCLGICASATFDRRECDRQRNR